LKATTTVKTGVLRTGRNKKISFERFVESVPDERRAHVMIMNERVFLPEAYLNQFVFATWNLELSNCSLSQNTRDRVPPPVLRRSLKIYD
jgi:hypothetical protein